MADKLSWIEVPFGAQDSELQEWKYNVPKGYTAEVKDGVVIIRKSESEDERTRKYLIDFVGLSDNPRKGEMIAYLEKQKEQNVIVYDGDSYKSAKEKAWNNFSGKASLIPEAKSIHDNGFRGGYQFGIHEEKPLKWTVHDEAVRKEAIACLEEWKHLIPYSSIEDYDNILNWLKEELSIHTEKQEQKPVNHNLTTWHRDVVYSAMCDKNLDEGLRCNLEVVYKTIKELVDRTPVVEEQKPADDKAFEEWIDDWWKHNKVNNPDSYDKGDEIQFDEKGFKNFCRGIRNMYQQKPAESAGKLSREEYLHQLLINQLITYSDYEYLTGKRPAWSEEDEKMLDNICSHLYATPEERDKMQKWLKSLRPSWKPTEEQMEALAYAIQLLDDGLSPKAAKADEELEHLREQLKKL